MTRTEAAYELLASRERFSESDGYIIDSFDFTGEELEKYKELIKDGYTLWLDGWECPCEGIKSEIVFDNGQKVTDKHPQEFNWGRDEHLIKYIIAYRVVGEREQEVLALEPRFTGVDSAAGNNFSKVSHYTDKTDTDLIDDFARHRTPEQFRGAMMFIIEKYIRRCGKKDDIDDEVYKIADYANRWLEYEERQK